MNNSYLLFLGISFLFVGIVALIHMLAYKGMGVFIGYGSNLATQLWIASRYLTALSFVTAALLMGKTIRTRLVFSGYALVTIFIFVTVFYWNIFPAAYIEGSGLTEFKIVSEYVICFIFLSSLFLLYRHRYEFDKRIIRLIYASIIISIGTELAFTTYVGVYDLANMIGHMLNILAYYLIYKAILETGISRPYALLLRSLKKSEEQLALHAEELATANSQLSSANEGLEAFNYSVSHDLRSPLRTIDGFSEILLEDYGEKLDDEGKEYLSGIRESSTRMSSLIDDLLILSRVTRWKMERKDVNLSRIVLAIAGDLQRMEPQRRVEFNIAPEIHVQADPGLIKIAMENLLGNAWKYTGKQSSAVIEFGVMKEDGIAIYFVRDNGAGFNMEYADKLFKAFQRLHADSEFPGTGIGLATVRRIIDCHGGQIRAEGRPGAGATFYFTLN